MRFFLLLFAFCTPGWCSSAPELVLQLGHNGIISQAAMSPSGQTIATVGEDGQVMLWNAQTGDLRSTLEGNRTHNVAFSPDGRFLLCSSYGTFQKWDSRTGNLLQQFACRGAGVFSPDTTRLATVHTGGGNAAIEILSTQTGEVLHRLGAKPVPNYATSLAWSPNGSTLAAGDYDGKLFLWRAQDGAHLNTIDFRPRGNADSKQIIGSRSFFLNALAFSSDGKLVAAAAHDAIRLAEISTGRITRKLSLGKTYEQHLKLLFSHDEQSLYAAATANAVRVWDIPTATLKGHLAQTRHVRSLSFAGKTDALLLAGEVPQLGLWNTATRRPQRIFHRVSHRPPYVGNVTVSRDGRYVLAKPWQSRGMLWDLRTPSQTAFPASGRWLPGDPPLLVSAQEKLLEWYRVPGGQIWKRITIPKPEPVRTPQNKNEVQRARSWEQDLQAHAVSSDGKFLVGFTRRKVFLFEARTGKLLRTLPGRTETISAAEFSPDGKFLAAGGGEEHGWGDEKGTITLWDLKLKDDAPKTLLAHNGVQSLAWSSDSSTLAVGCGNEEGEDSWGEIQLFDAARGKLTQYLLGHNSPVVSLAWARTDAESTILLASSRRDVKAWQPATVGRNSSKNLAQPLWSSERGAHVVHARLGKSNYMRADLHGKLEVRDVQTDALRATLLSLPADAAPDSPAAMPNWIIFTPEGYYTGSSKSEQWIRWRVDGKIYPAAKFKTQFHRPDKVRGALQFNS